MALLATFALIIAGHFAPASHADAPKPGTKPVWAVLDFQNSSPVGGPDFGRECAEALGTALRDDKRVVIEPRDSIYGDQGAIKQLSLTPPLDVVDLEKIGNFQGTDAVVTGEILNVERDQKGKRVKVTIAVRVMDTPTGMLINGALTEGTAYAQSAYMSDEATLDKAVRNAVRAAIAQMDEFDLPTATVLNYDDPDQVIIDKGSRNGMRPGLNMMVLRRGFMIGLTRLVHVDRDTSVAAIVED